MRENPDIVRGDLEKRNDKEKLEWLGDLLKKEAEYRKLLQENQALRQSRNTITEEINKLRKQGIDIKAKVQEAKELPDKIKQSDETLQQLKEKIDDKTFKKVLEQLTPKRRDIKIKKV